MNTTNQAYHNEYSSTFNQHHHQEDNLLGLSFVNEPCRTDVISGRRKKCINHPGNKYFIQKIRDRLHFYTSATKKIEKSLEIESILNALFAEGIRFLKYDESTDLYFIMSDAQARKKTAHALRDLLKGMNKKQSKSKQCIRKQKQSNKDNQKSNDGNNDTNDKNNNNNGSDEMPQKITLERVQSLSI